MRLRYWFVTLLLIAFTSQGGYAQTFFTAHLTSEQQSAEVDSTGAGTAASFSPTKVFGFSSASTVFPDRSRTLTFTMLPWA